MTSHAYAARRKALNVHYDYLPTQIDGCYYCGVFADSYDHVPSLSAVHALGPSHFEKKKIKLYLVPACKECNSLLVHTAAFTVAERKKVIKTKLRKRYAKFLNSPDWTHTEIEELGYNLRVMVEQAGTVKGWVKRRLEW